MSAETIEWLNQNTMLGFTAHREKYKGMGWVRFNENTGQNEAWWHRDDFENGFEGAIRPEDVQRVLFNWEPVETEVMHRVPCDVATADGVDGAGNAFYWVPDLKRKGIMHPDTEHVFSVMGKDTYKIHSYNEWLVNNVGRILDTDEVGIASAGLLRDGGVAYVQVEMPEDVNVAGMDIRPSIIAATSIDGTKATVYKITTGISICDNSLDLNLRASGNQLKIRHSSKSLGRMNDARDALGIMFAHTEEITKFLESLSNVDVTNEQFKQIVHGIKPIPLAEVKAGKVSNQRAITIAENTQQDLLHLYHQDARCTPWNGTMLGAMQAVNTWNNHMRSNSDNGVERVMTATLGGDIAKRDAEFFDIVAGLDIFVPTLATI
jgi:phage/plasmid-like protein (TIGR03299 family)